MGNLIIQFYFNYFESLIFIRHLTIHIGDYILYFIVPTQFYSIK